MRHAQRTRVVPVSTLGVSAVRLFFLLACDPRPSPQAQMSNAPIASLWAMWQRHGCRSYSLPTTIASLLKRFKERPQSLDGSSSEAETIHGWVRAVRLQKKVAFAEIADGSQLAGLQVVMEPEQAANLAVGCSLQAHGKLVQSIGKEQPVEFAATRVTLLGHCSPQDSYPLQKKHHSTEFLRSLPHLRPRTRQTMAIMSIRNAAMMALHHYFQDNEFVNIATPIITGQDCEGGGEIFGLATHDSCVGPRPGQPAAGKLFFGQPAYLTVSGQLHLEAAAHAYARVYTFGPTFRAEPSNTTRHLAEFWMLEAEVAFVAELAPLLSLIESCIKSVVARVASECKEELLFLESHWHALSSSSGHVQSAASLDRLNAFAKQPFAVLSYTECIEMLKQANNIFQVPITEWGQMLGSEHEQYLAQKVAAGPVFITNYPCHERPFYMRQNEDKRTVANTDLILPEFGELVGGSLREERLERLVARMTALQMDVRSLDWYLDTRRFGSVSHGGFGLGFERFVQFLTGTHNIRDVILMPRSPGHLSC